MVGRRGRTGELLKVGVAKAWLAAVGNDPVSGVTDAGEERAPFHPYSGLWLFPSS